MTPPPERHDDDTMVIDILRGSLRAVARAAAGFLALLILFEEWGWEPLQRWLERVGRLPMVRELEAAIKRLHPRSALLLFLLPTLLLLPVKLLALGLIAQGSHLLGLAVIVVAKLVGTAVVARLFTLTRPALLHMPWFAVAYGHWSIWKDALLMRVRGSLAWRTGRALKRLARLRWDDWRRG